MDKSQIAPVQGIPRGGQEPINLARLSVLAGDSTEVARLDSGFRAILSRFPAKWLRDNEVTLSARLTRYVIVLLTRPPGKNISVFCCLGLFADRTSTFVYCFLDVDIRFIALIFDDL